MNKIRIFLISFLVMLLVSSAARAQRGPWFLNLITRNGALANENRDNIEKQAERIDGLEQHGGSQTEETAQKKLYANGVPVGIIVDDNINLTLEFNSSFEPVKVGVNGRIAPDDRFETVLLFFSEPNCQGEAYVDNYHHYEVDGSIPFKLRREKGKIYSCTAPECEYPLYYATPGDNKYYFVSITSSYIDGMCRSHGIAHEQRGYRILPNDSAVTGIEQYPFPLPLTFDGMEELQMKLVIP